jgi:RHS repeat-associated protein
LTDRGGKIDWIYPSNSDKLQSLTFTHSATIQSLNYIYNELDQNTLVKDGSLTYRFDYDERGNIRTYTAANGSGATFNYDEAGQFKNISVGSSTGEAILNERYSYDKNGNRIKIEETDSSIINYEFDSLDQLTKETLKDGTIQEYQYDGFGNRINTKKTKGGVSDEIHSTFNLANQLIKFGSEDIAYDKNGNRKSDGKHVYEWNAADQLISVTKKGESTPFATYEYDNDGRRTKKVVNGDVTNYFYNGDDLNILYETDGQNNVVRSYSYSETGDLLSIKKGSQYYYYHYNGHGDVIALTDSKGIIVAKYQYDSWGNQIKVEEDEVIKDNPFRYSGYHFDSETGLYYLIARYYDSKQGVFYSSDPYPGDDDDILTQNGYSYANNNPVMLVDPDGNLSKIIKGVTYVWKGGKWVAGKAKKAFKKKKPKKKISKAMVDSALGKLNENSRKHILESKHAWRKVTSNPKSWKSVSKVIKKVMTSGKESSYGSARQKTKKIKKKTVVVTFVRLKDGSIRISNAWVKTK